MISFDSSGSNLVDLSSTMNRSLQPKYRVPQASTVRPNKTPGTANNSTRTLRSYTVLCILEGRGVSKGTIGVASMDIRYPDLELCEFIDSSAYTRLKSKIQIEDPIEIVVADSINDKPATLLIIEAIKSAFQDITITTVHKRYFNEQRGCELVQQLANAEISKCDQLIQQQKKFSMAACAALIKYVEHIQNLMFSGNSLRVVYKDVEKMCLMDMGSWKSLEIIDVDVKTSANRGERRSLLSVLDNTLTPGGARLLRSNLLQPSAETSLIEARLDAVEELLDDTHLLDRLREILARVYELDHVLSICVKNIRDNNVQNCENNIMQLLRLKRTLEIVEPLRQAFGNVKSPLLCNKKEWLSDTRIDEIMDLLDDSIDSSVLATNRRNSITIRNQKCYAIKENMSVNLDVARKAYEELLKDLQTQETELTEHLPKENTRLAFSVTRGFHYVWVCPNAGTARLPPIFINDVRNRSSLTFSSRKLMRYNDRIDQSVAEVLLASDAVAQDIIEQIRPHVPVLYFLMDTIANTDFLCSLAMYASNTRTTRPRFGPSLLFREGRHPLLDLAIPDSVIGNDTYLTPDSRFAIITGPNMAGKSTYLKQVCQLSVLAQTGSMVPADLASIPVFTRIFSRVGHNDNLVQSLSAFAVEMSEMAVILQYADDRSLVVIDELARSTATEEGIGISYAIAEELLRKGSLTMLATHFLDLATLDIKYTAVENFHFSAQTRTDDDNNEIMDATHKLYKGPYTGPLYGFELVELSTFPDSVTAQAREMAAKLRAESENKRRMTVETATRRVLVRTAHRLRQAIVMSRSGSASEQSIRRFISDVRQGMLSGLREAEEMEQEQDQQGGSQGESQAQQEDEQMEVEEEQEGAPSGVQGEEDAQQKQDEVVPETVEEALNRDAES